MNVGEMGEGEHGTDTKGAPTGWKRPIFVGLVSSSIHLLSEC
jgi:hypothetical protein